LAAGTKFNQAAAEDAARIIVEDIGSGSRGEALGKGQAGGSGSVAPGTLRRSG
jgi:hypothetical protein